MKNFTIVHVLLLLLMLLAYQCANAQSYVITIKGDSIAGEVKPLAFGNERRVQVTTSDKAKKVFTAFQVQRFVFRGDTYRPVRKDNMYVFMKVIREGYLTLYAFQQENQLSYDGLFLQKRDGGYLEVPNLSFRKIVAKFLSDCSDVSRKITSGEYGKQQIETIVVDYNACIDQKTVQRKTAVVVASDPALVTPAWDLLERKVREAPSFAEKNDAVEMIADIKLRLSRNEKVPNYMVEGLRTSLKSANLTSELENALNEIKKSQ